MSIHLKPSHRGLMHRDLGYAAGTKIPLSAMLTEKRSSDPAKRKRATFAINARQWNHE